MEGACSNYIDVNRYSGDSDKSNIDVSSIKNKHKLGNQSNYNSRAKNCDDNASHSANDAISSRGGSINKTVVAKRGNSNNATNRLKAIRKSYANTYLVGASSKSKDKNINNTKKKIRRTRKDKGTKRVEAIKPDLYCEICNRHFTKRPNLLSHMQTHAQTITCETCGKQFRWRSTLLKHMLAHVGEIPNTNSQFQLTTANTGTNDASMNDSSGNVNDTNTNSSDAIYKVNDSSSNEAIYNLKDTVSKPIFTNNNVLNPLTGKPKQTRTSTKKAHLCCEVCNRTFSKRPNMLSHMRIHMRTIKCETCGKTFVSGVNLRQHMLTHIGWRPHKCDVCGKTFTQKGNLLKHLFAHTGERPHVCEFCGKSFGEKSHLKSHQLTHTGERPHTCETCGRSFADKSTLRRHAVTHTTERPYVCDVCGRTFARKGYLTAHLVAHGGVKNFICEVCSKAYARKKDLIKHFTVSHPEVGGVSVNRSMEADDNLSSDDAYHELSTDTEHSPLGGSVSAINGDVEHLLVSPDVCFSAIKTHEELCDIVSDSGDED